MNSEVLISWLPNPEANIVGYRLSVAEVGFSTQTPDTSQQVTVPRGTPIHVELRAVNDAGNESPSPATMEFTLSDVPPPPPPPPPDYPSTPTGLTYTEL